MPALSWNEIRQRAIQFSREWSEETREHAEAQTFWNEFFHVFGMKRRQVASFEERVKSIKGQHRIDLFWKGTLLAEHKSRGEDLGKASSQAFNYIQELINDGRQDECPRYVAISDFAKIILYDLEPDDQLELPRASVDGPMDIIEIPVADFHKHIKHFAFVAGLKTQRLREQDPANLKATRLMADLHDALELGGYAQPELERLLVRLLFCLFADDTGVFEPDSFELFIENRTRPDGYDLGMQLARLFQLLDTPEAQRGHIHDDELLAFPYINGELFSEQLHFAEFNQAMREALLAACRFKWDKVSPAVFGSLFQGVMDSKERRQIGAHYTSERDILKLIGPLFLDALTEEFEQLAGDRSTRRKARLEAFQQKLAALTFLDPACGCGNFLVLAYRELRRLELKALKLLHEADQVQQLTAIDLAELSQVDVDQFYGIEIDMWPSRIAETALWLTDHQMNRELSEAFGQIFLRIPLKKSPHIHCANALTTDWATVLPPEQCSYILGNPPFVGGKYQTKEQKADLKAVAGDIQGHGLLDFVTLWYLKAADYMKEAKPGGADASSIRNAGKPPAGADASSIREVGELTQDASAPAGADASSIRNNPTLEASPPFYFNPLAPIEITEGDLPHWEQKNCTYFVTFRLADSLPQDKLNEWKRDKDNWLRRNPPPHDDKQKEEYQREFGGKIEEWLKQGHGSCLLKHNESSKLLAEAMQHFHEQRYFLHRAVIMSNHVHVLVTPLLSHKLRDILHSWKSFTANKINEQHQRKGSLWQRESFDTIIRSQEHLNRVVSYMDENAASPACVLDILPTPAGADASSIRYSVKPTLEASPPHEADASSIRNKPTLEASPPQPTAAFVSTNSITMGEQVGVLWPALFAKGVHIHFAHRTFSWQSEASGAAHVHVVIIGFGLHEAERKTIYEYEHIKGEPKAVPATQINPYLVDGPRVAISNRSKPLCDVPEMSFGNQPIDGGHLLLDNEQKNILLNSEPEAQQFIRSFLGSREFINGLERWCLWLTDAPPQVLRNIKGIQERIEEVRKFRLESKRLATRQLAATPYKFAFISHRDKPYLLVPSVSSERRPFIPLGFMSPEVIASNLCLTVPDASPYHFGVLSSAMHMAWVRQVCGRLKSDFRYSAKLVYNNYPWPVEATEAQQARIAEAAQAVLDVRQKYLGADASSIRNLGKPTQDALPPAGADASSIRYSVNPTQDASPPEMSAPLCTLADLYDPLTMPADLLKAHQGLDTAVDKAYRGKKFETERERVEFLFALYEKLTAPIAAQMAEKPKRKRKPKAKG